jgi:hypothetical protein
MPIFTDTVRIAYKLLPLVLNADGSAMVALRRGYVKQDGEWIEIDCNEIQISAENTSLVLDAMPTPGLTRRDDLSYVIYTYLVENGLAPAGEVS